MDLQEIDSLFHEIRDQVRLEKKPFTAADHDWCDIEAWRRLIPLITQDLEAWVKSLRTNNRELAKVLEHMSTQWQPIPSNAPGHSACVRRHIKEALENHKSLESMIIEHANLP